MVKLIGIVLVFTAAVLSGYCFARKFSRREKNIADMVSAIRIIHREIAFAQNTIPAILETVGAAALGEVSEFFAYVGKKLQKRSGSPLSDIWAAALGNKQMGLKSEDIRVLRVFGRLLGTGDVREETENCENTISQLLELYSYAKSDNGKNGKLCRALGVLGGFAIVILLI